MIVGGATNDPSRKSEDKAYALSLRPSSVEVPSCLERICDFPHYIECPSMAIFDNGLPTVCGGRRHTGSAYVHYKECYQFNHTENGWGLPIGSKDKQGVHTGKSYLLHFASFLYVNAFRSSI